MNFITRGSFCNYIITYTASFHKHFTHFPDIIRSKHKPCINFPRIEKQPYNFRRQTGDTKQFPYWGTIVQNVVALVNWRLGFVHPCLAPLPMAGIDDVLKLFQVLQVNIKLNSWFVCVPVIRARKRRHTGLMRAIHGI
jgi:hypothetical protein